jgi:hypothetical protein
MTTTTIETVIATLEARIAEQRIRLTDYHDQIATLDRERFVIKAHLDAYVATLALLNGTEAEAPETPATRAKKGEIDAAVLKVLADWKDGMDEAGILQRVDYKAKSIQAALARMVQNGTILGQAGDRYRLPFTGDPAVALEQVPEAEQERSAAE